MKQRGSLCLSSLHLGVLVCKTGEELAGVQVSLKVPSESVILRDLLKDQTKKDIDTLQPYMSAVPVFSTGRGCQAPPTPIYGLGAMLCSLHTLLWV